MEGNQAVPGVLSDAEVDSVVSALRAVNHNSAWERILQIGRIIFERVVDADEGEWRSRRGNKNLSLRKLVQHPACPFRKTALGSAVNVLLFVKGNPAIRDLPRLTPTHVTQVLGLPTDAALSLLQESADGSWSIRELSVRARLLRRQQGDRRGRPIAPADQKAQTLAYQAAGTLNRMLAQLSEVDGIDEERVAALHEGLEEVSRLVQEIRGLPVMRRSPALMRRSGLIEAQEALAG